MYATRSLLTSISRPAHWEKVNERLTPASKLYLRATLSKNVTALSIFGQIAAKIFGPRWGLGTRSGKSCAKSKLTRTSNSRGRHVDRSGSLQAGIWMSRAERKRIQQPRHRREHIGELVQIDGSEHRWFEDRAATCTLLVFVDDATSRLMELRFVASESTFAYFEALKAYLRRHGKPVAFYS